MRRLPPIEEERREGGGRREEERRKRGGREEEREGGSRRRRKREEDRKGWESMLPILSCQHFTILVNCDDERGWLLTTARILPPFS